MGIGDLTYGDLSFNLSGSKTVGGTKPYDLLKTLLSSLDILLILTATTGRIKFCPGFIRS